MTSIRRGRELLFSKLENSQLHFIFTKNKFFHNKQNLGSSQSTPSTPSIQSPSNSTSMSSPNLVVNIIMNHTNTLNRWRKNRYKAFNLAS